MPDLKLPSGELDTQATDLRSDEYAYVGNMLGVLPPLSAPVATIGHLITLKILAGRNQDLI